MTETWRSSYAKNLQPVDISEIDEAATKLQLGRGGRKTKECMEARQDAKVNVMKRVTTKGAVFIGNSSQSPTLSAKLKGRKAIHYLIDSAALREPS